eukprot:359491-Chlamydomonas_euryale.AAC.7
MSGCTLKGWQPHKDSRARSLDDLHALYPSLPPTSSVQLSSSHPSSPTPARTAPFVPPGTDRQCKNVGSWLRLALREVGMLQSLLGGDARVGVVVEHARKQLQRLRRHQALGWDGACARRGALYGAGANWVYAKECECEGACPGIVLTVCGTRANKSADRPSTVAGRERMLDSRTLAVGHTVPRVQDSRP